MIGAYPKTQEIQFSSFFSLFLFQTAKSRSDKTLRDFVAYFVYSNSKSKMLTVSPS